MLRPGTRLLVTLALSACVLPYGGAAGVEVTWSLREANAVDGDEARRLRTCAGADLQRVALTVVDADDPSRARTFAHPCAAGNPPPATRATEPPEIFIDLRAGNYDLAATGLDAADAPNASAVAAVEVEAHAVTAVDLELARPLQPLELELTGACTTLSAALRYADPAADLLLADPEAPPPVYRERLRSDRDLRLGGADDQPCAPLLGLHRLAVDPGRYLLELTVDGRACALPLAVEDSPVRLALDLENPACGG